jgi:hypothetical protein
MVFRRFLAEILQRRYRALAKLNFVENDKRPPLRNRLTANMGQYGNQLGRTDILGKSRGERLVGLKIEISDVVVSRPSKFQNRVGLSKLPGSLND